MTVGNTSRLVVSTLCVWGVLVIVMLIASSGSPAPHDWYAVLAIGTAASIGLLLGSWRKSRF